MPKKYMASSYDLIVPICMPSLDLVINVNVINLTEKRKLFSIKRAKPPDKIPDRLT